MKIEYPSGIIGLTINGSRSLSRSSTVDNCYRLKRVRAGAEKFSNLHTASIKYASW